jgi:hypothetical protein
MRRVFFLLLVLFTTACDESVERHYQNYAELQRAGAGAKSWMPDWLPASATDIYDWHDLDTSSTLVAFSVPNASPILLRGCRRVAKVTNPGDASIWWPNDRAFSAMQHFECDDRITYQNGQVDQRAAGAAIDPATNRVYFWR